MSIQQEKFKEIANKIRRYAKSEDLIKPNEFASKIDDVANVQFIDGQIEGKREGYAEGYPKGYEDAETAFLPRITGGSATLQVALRSGEMPENSGDVAELEDNANQAKSDITAIKTLIENHGVEVPVGTPSSTYDETIEEIIDTVEEERDNLNQEITEANTQLVTILNGGDTGGKSYYDEFWDSIQSNGTRTNYEYAFMGESWKYNALKPKYLPIIPQFTGSMFEKCGATNVDLTDIVKITWDCWGYVRMCKDFTGLVKFGDFICVHNNCQEIFYGCTNLASVRTFTSQSATVFTSTFYNCKALTDITFAGTIANSFDISYSPLNKASIKSLIGCLSTTITGKTLSLKKTAVNNAFGINIDDETTYPVGSEFYELRHSKDNWTFSYM